VFYATVNLHEAKTNLSRLVEEAAKGNSFIIAKAGKPLVKVMPLSAEEREGAEKLGFMAGEISTPDDFDSLGTPEIVRLFEGKSA
jgi:prevent-host-death family protein